MAVKVEVRSLTSDPPAISATIWGEKFDPEIHETRTGVKAITYHRMEVLEKEGEFILRYFVDI